MEEFDEIVYVYEKLKDRYNLMITTTAELNEGYTIDIPVLCGEGKCGKFRLYDYGMLTLDVDLESGTRTHTHCLYGDYAVDDVVAFIEGTHRLFS